MVGMAWPFAYVPMLSGICLGVFVLIHLELFILHSCLT